MLVSCGGGGTSHPSRATRRAFVSNTFGGVLDIVDLSKDQVVAGTVPASGSGSFLGLSPTFMVLSQDKTLTAVFDATLNSVGLVENDKENVRGTITLPSWTESIVLSPDSLTGWAAVRNAPVADQPTTGAVAVLDLVNGGLTTQLSIPLVRYLALNHAGTKLLAFADQSNSAYLVDLAHANAITPIPGFDRPVAAIFSADDSKAYVLSCGPECGGTAASVRVLDMATNTPGASVAVPGATVGLLDGGNLYVAGTAPSGSAAPGGFLSVISVANLTLANSAPIAIGDGHHASMALAGTGDLYIGALTCTNLEGVTNSGCLSIYQPASSTVTVPNPNCGRDRNAPALTCGDVTALQPITGRNQMFIIQGGELVIYDTTTRSLQNTQIDFVGKVYGVKEID